jgi:5-formyltetrahydrofolate cyclo-ligase
MSDSNRPGGFEPHEAHGKGSLYPDEIIARKVKTELRKRMRGVRVAAPASACAVRSEKIRARLSVLPAVTAARSIALFFPIEGKNEVDLLPLHEALSARGVSVAYPSIDPDTGEMTFRVPTSLDLLEERGKGFREPPYECEALHAPDVIVVPALAVAPTGHRLGYGAGYYDRALAVAAGSFTVAVVYDYQLLVELPVLPHDVPVAHVVTDTRDFAAER